MGHDLRERVVDHLPRVRAVALMLARDGNLADDLVQETVVRALSHSHQFQPGTNFEAWIAAILRNSHFSEIRYRIRAARIAANLCHDDPTYSGGQEEALDLRDFNRAFRALTPLNREALVLVGRADFPTRKRRRLPGVPWER